MCLNFRCPSASNDSNAQKCKNYFHHLNGKKQIVPSLICIIALRYHVSLMESQKFSESDEKYLKLLCRFITKDPAIYYFIIDEINRNIFVQSPR